MSKKHTWGERITTKQSDSQGEVKEVQLVWEDAILDAICAVVVYLQKNLGCAHSSQPRVAKLSFRS